MAERIKSPWRKIWTILTSRFRKEREEDWVKERREQCAKCCHNTLNIKDISWKVRVAKLFSDFYTAITLAKNKNLGQCSICFCELYFKQLMPEESCSADLIGEDPKWTSILPERNSKKKAR